jgi:hypothetical protein
MGPEANYGVDVSARVVGFLALLSAAGANRLGIGVMWMLFGGVRLAVPVVARTRAAAWDRDRVSPASRRRLAHEERSGITRLGLAAWYHLKRTGLRMVAVGLTASMLATCCAMAGTANASGWTSPSLSICDHGNDLWQAFGFGYQKSQYRMDAGGFVHFRGSVACPTAANDSQLFVLPKSFRPFENEKWMIASGNGGGSFDAYPDISIDHRSGQVLFSGPYTGAFVSLSGIEFAQTRWTAASLKPCASGKSWTSIRGSRVGFVRDSDGVVHLRGNAICASSSVSSRVILKLPKADRPARAEVFTVVEGGAPDAAVIEVDPNGSVGVGGDVGPGPIVSLSGVAFDAAGAHTSGRWRAPKLASCATGASWQSFGFGYQGPRFRIDARGFVHLSGAVACPVTATSGVLFKLPSRLAPRAKEVFPIATGNGVGGFNEGAAVEVDPDGTVFASASSNSSFISLAPIEFSPG